MHIRTNPALNKIFQPLIYFCEWLGEHHPIVLAEIRYYARFKKKLNLGTEIPALLIPSSSMHLTAFSEP